MGRLCGRPVLPWDEDDLVAQKVLEVEGRDRYRAPFVNEGGAIHVDGQGTALVTEECMLNPNRNPELARTISNSTCVTYLGVQTRHLAGRRRGR